MKLAKSLLTEIVNWVNARRTTLIFWVFAIAVVFVSISVNRAHDAAVVAKLNSTSQAVRDAEVLDLARSGNLSEVLLSTEDPGGDSTSAQNVLSAQIRAEAGDSLVRDIPQLTPDQAFNNLYAMEKDSVTATSAVNGLSLLGESSDKNLQTLTQGLGDGDPDVRTAAVAALSQIGGQKVIDLTAPLVNVDAAQDSALSILMNLGKLSVPTFDNLLLNSSNPEALRESAAGDLGTIGSASASPTLESVAQAPSTDRELRRVCLTSLAMIVLATLPAPSIANTPTPSPSDPSSIAAARAESPILIASVLNPDDDSFARSREAVALGRLGTHDAVEALVQSLGSPDLQLAAAAQVGVESVGQAAVDQLRAVLNVPDQQVRSAAAISLGVIGTPEALDAVTPALSDRSSQVRRNAAEGLGRSGNPAAIALLLPLLSDPDGTVAATVSNSLHELGQPAVSSLVSALAPTDLQATKSFFASQALAEDGEEAVPALIRASANAPVNQKVWIAVTLGAMHNPEVVPTLQILASDKSKTVAWAANQALNQYLGDS